MGKTRSMSRDQNHDDASIRKKIKTCDPWSDLNYDVLFLVMMRLGVVDFLAFSRVCKSWRSLAVSNRNKFIVSRPPMPMSISISTDANHESKCYLEDFEGRKLKISLPHSDYKACVGVSYGYLILIREKTNIFWLVNPITRHEFHVPSPFLNVHSCTSFLGDILVFSPLRRCMWPDPNLHPDEMEMEKGNSGTMTRRDGQRWGLDYPSHHLVYRCSDLTSIRIP
ncbi:unnamed protein product [Lactuca virosa]|uniref:F-box domain-containing protein n=1 Tax=Lactuca virosa TaxID=75947 RepID=A0AAU9PJG7_9ASTR|nr:unnamed protein product [Lactuca virosa]